MWGDHRFSLTGALTACLAHAIRFCFKCCRPLQIFLLIVVIGVYWRQGLSSCFVIDWLVSLVSWRVFFHYTFKFVLSLRKYNVQNLLVQDKG